MRIRLFYILILLPCLNSCFSDSKKSEILDKQLSLTENAAIEVQTVTAMFEPFNYHIEGTGRLEPYIQVQITFQAGGLLEELSIKNGKWVQKGQELARLNSTKQKLALEKIQSELYERQVDYEYQLLGFPFAEKDSNYYSDIKKNLQYSSGLILAKVRLKEAQLELEHTCLTAPMSGIVANVEVKEGNFIQQGTKLCIIYAKDPLILSTKVLESDIALIRVGQEAKVYPLAKPDTSYMAKVQEINPMVGENGMVQVKLILHETEGLLPGMHTTAMIKVPQDKGIVVPKEAVVIRSGRKMIFTEEEGLAKGYFVQTGLENAKKIQILDGLEAGGQVIISNNLQLAQDAPIKVKKKGPTHDE